MSRWVGLVVVALVVALTVNAVAKYGGGSGTEGDPYQIWDANQMQAIGADANDWDKHFILMADIDLGQFTSSEFNIIAPDPNTENDWYDGTPFTGLAMTMSVAVPATAVLLR